MIYRLKLKHKKCHRVLSEVKQEIKELSHRKSRAKAKKVVDVKENQAQLHGTREAIKDMS